MPRECSICGNRNRQAIEALIRNKVPLRKVGAEYRVGFTALSRHSRHMSSSDPLALPEKKRRYVEARLEGKSKRQAVVAAGYAPGSATAGKKLEAQPDVRAAFSALVRETVPADEIAETLKAGLKATDTKFFAEKGVIQEREVIDWSERRQYAELAAELGGYHARDSKEQRGGGGVIIILPDPDPEPENRTVVAAAAIQKPGPIMILPDAEESDG